MSTFICENCGSPNGMKVNDCGGGISRQRILCSRCNKRRRVVPVEVSADELAGAVPAPDTVTVELKGTAEPLRVVSREAAKPLNLAVSKCMKTDCPNRAHWYPSFKLYAKDSLGSPPAVADLELKLCNEHIFDLQVSALLTDEAWQQIVDGFKAAGKAEPDRSRAELVWKPLEPVN